MERPLGKFEFIIRVRYSMLKTGKNEYHEIEINQ